MVFKTDIYFLQIGLIVAISFFTASIFSIVFATLADWLIISGWLSVTHTRKLACHICLIGSAVGFAAIGFADCDYKLATTLIVMAITLNHASLSGYFVRQQSE